MRLDFSTDEGADVRLGLIVLQVDETVETEFRRLVGTDGIALYCSRVPSGAEVTEETLSAMAAHIPAAARLLPPAAPLDVVGYACTSGATMIGSDCVAALVRAAAPHLSRAAVTDPLAAVKAACRSLGVRRLGFVSPYAAAVSAAMRAALEADGLGVTAFGSFEQAEERLVARITPSSVLEAILQIGKSSETDAVFASCTNLRTLGILEDAERSLGKPVISSNLALSWHMLRLAGVGGPGPTSNALFAA